MWLIPLLDRADAGYYFFRGVALRRDFDTQGLSVHATRLSKQVAKRLSWQRIASAADLRTGRMRYMDFVEEWERLGSLLVEERGKLESGEVSYNTIDACKLYEDMEFLCFNTNCNCWSEADFKLKRGHLVFNDNHEYKMRIPYALLPEHMVGTNPENPEDRSIDTEPTRFLNYVFATNHSTYMSPPSRSEVLRMMKSYEEYIANGDEVNKGALALLTFNQLTPIAEQNLYFKDLLTGTPLMPVFIYYRYRPRSYTPKIILSSLPVREVRRGNTVVIRLPLTVDDYIKFNPFLECYSKAIIETAGLRDEDSCFVTSDETGWDCNVDESIDNWYFMHKRVVVHRTKELISSMHSSWANLTPNYLFSSSDTAIAFGRGALTPPQADAIYADSNPPDSPNLNYPNPENDIVNNLELLDFLRDVCPPLKGIKSYFRTILKSRYIEFFNEDVANSTISILKDMLNGLNDNKNSMNEEQLSFAFDKIKAIIESDAFKELTHAITSMHYSRYTRTDYNTLLNRISNIERERSRKNEGD